MSDIFENDIDDESQNLDGLEDSPAEEGESFEVDQPLCHIKLDYSSETLYANVPSDIKLFPRDFVITPTRYGKDLGRVLGFAKKPIGIKPSDIVTVDRKATSEDLKKIEDFQRREKEAFPIFREKAELHHLEMKLVAVHFLFDEPKVLFFFNAEKRVDFRDLVKDLVSIFKMRIELRQIGPRDESRITGGLGVCGRPFCCHAFSDKPKSVSIRMAKDQDLSLNSIKISGQCGKLLCCLAYEFDWYSEARKNLPPEGIRIFYDETNFRIISVNPTVNMIKMAGEDGRILEVNAKRFYLDGNQWKIK